MNYKEEKLAQENALLKALANYIGADNYAKFADHSRKYRIDGCLYNNNKQVVAFAECKWYTSHSYLWINIPKYNEMKLLCETTGLNGYFVFREPSKCGFLTLFRGSRQITPHKTIWAGGTPKHRDTQHDDYEPLLQLERKIEWIAP